MRAAIDDVHHWDRKHFGVRAAEVSEKREAKLIRGSAGGCERHSQNRVRAQLAFVGRSVERDHRLVQAHLIESVHVGHFFRDDFFHIRNGLGDATAEEAPFLAVAQFPCLVFSRARAARDDGAAGAAARKSNYGFNSGIAAGIDDLTAMDSDDLCKRHNRCFLLNWQ